MEVYREVVLEVSERQTGKEELQYAVKNKNIELYSVIDDILVTKLYGKLHRGELEVIVSAQELKINFVLLDDLAARKLAKDFSLIPLGTLGILAQAKEEGLIERIKPYIDKLIANGFHVSRRLCNKVLSDVGEI